MKYFLDANTCIYFLKGKNINVKNNVEKRHPSQIKIPSIVKAELLYGVKKSERVKENEEKLNEFLLPYEIVPFGNAETESYSLIRSDLESRGKIIGPNDLFISAIVLSNKGTIVTHNMDEFSRVKNLKITDWSIE